MKRFLLIVLLVLVAGCVESGVSVSPNAPWLVTTSQISKVKGIPTSHAVSSQDAVFRERDELTTEGLEKKTGVPEGSVLFCTQVSDYCHEDYLVSSEYFDANPTNIIAKQDSMGKVRAYNADGTYYMGYDAGPFVEKQPSIIDQIIGPILEIILIPWTMLMGVTT